MSFLQLKFSLNSIILKFIPLKILLYCKFYPSNFLIPLNQIPEKKKKKQSSIPMRINKFFVFDKKHMTNDASAETLWFLKLNAEREKKTVFNSNDVNKFFVVLPSSTRNTWQITHQPKRYDCLNWMLKGKKNSLQFQWRKQILCGTPKFDKKHLTNDASAETFWL